MNLKIIVITLFSILYINCLLTYSQEYRVKSLTIITQHHHVFGITDTIKKRFNYKDSILTKVVLTRSNDNIVTELKVAYQPNKNQIIFGNKKFQFDSKNRITNYISNAYNYSIKYDNQNRPIELVRDSDTLGIIHYNHFYRYKKTIDSLIMPLRGFYIKRAIYKYTFDYQENILTAVSNWSGGMWVNFYFERSMDYMIIIEKDNDGRLHRIHEFFYNKEGLLIKETVKEFGASLFETKTILIEYENYKGNEDFLFKINNWMYNFYLGIKTFYDFEDVRF